MRLIILSFLFLVSACGERDSNYEAIKSLQGEQRLQRFKTFPVPERVRLYNKVYEESGHPADTDLAIGFDDKPDEALSYILSDLERSTFSDFMRYVPVIYRLSRHPSFDICQPQRIAKLRSILQGYRLDKRQQTALEDLKFQKCRIT